MKFKGGKEMIHALEAIGLTAKLDAKANPPLPELRSRAAYAG
jgi:hypothetical protein